MKILITGASGFIGRHLSSSLRLRGHSVEGFTHEDGDIASVSTWSNAGETDVVVHLAGKTSVTQSWKETDEFHRVNLGGIESAINFCKKRGSKLVFLSSFVYSPKEGSIYSESDELHASNPYAETKIKGEQICRNASSGLDRGVVILRPFNAYGPGQQDTFLIPRLVGLIKNRLPVEVTDLEPRRDYVYITDIVDAITAAAMFETQFDIFNIGTGSSHSVANVIENIFDIAGYRCEISSSKNRRRNEVMDTIANIDKAARLLNWTPRFSLESGLRAIWTGVKD